MSDSPDREIPIQYVVNVNIFNIQANNIVGDMNSLTPSVQQEVANLRNNEIESEPEPVSWHRTWWGVALIGVLVAVVGGGILYWLGWL